MKFPVRAIGLAAILCANSAAAEPTGADTATLEAMIEAAYEIDPRTDEPAYRAAFEDALAFARTLYPERHPELALIEYELATADMNVGRFAQGAARVETIIPILREAGEEYRPTLLGVMNALLVARVRMGDLPAAREIGEEVLVQRRELLAADPDNQALIAGLAASLNNSGFILNMDGQPMLAIEYMGEVETLIDRLDEPSPELLSYLTNTPTYWAASGNSDLALREGQRLTAKLEVLLPPNHPVLANSYNSLSVRAAERGQLDDAERFSRRAIALALNAENPDMAMASSMRLGLAQTLIKKGDPAAALAVVDEALVFLIEGYGEKGELTLYAQHVRAHALRDLGRTQEAIAVAEAADALRAETMQPGNDRRIAGQESLAEFYLEAGRPIDAYTTQGLAQNARLTIDSTLIWEQLTGDILLGAYAQRAGLEGLGLVTGAHAGLMANRDAIIAAGEPDAVQLAILGQANDWALDAAMQAKEVALAFGFAQHALATKADRSAQSAAFRRGLAQADAAAVRLYQDRAEALRLLAQQQIEQMSRGVTPEEMLSMREELAAARAQLLEAGTALDLSSFTAADPIDLASAQAILGKDEALLLVQPMPMGLAVIVVTRDETAMQVSPLTTREVAALAGAMRDALTGKNILSRGVIASPSLNMPPDYDFAPGAALYDAIFSGETGALLAKVSHLRIAAGGALSRIPFAALAPAAGSLEEADWLVRRYSISIVASFVTLGEERPALAGKSSRVLAVGAPVLAGGNLFALRSARELTEDMLVTDLPPLPAAEAELAAIAQALDTLDSVLLVGEDARERRVLEELAHPASVIAFATHGLLEGELSGLDEPALVLTSGEAEDGLLKASEIAALDMDADWVILSACNTGGPDRSGSAGLSGLASAFLYAGARNLLVSHWEVADDVARSITVPTVEDYYRGGLSPAEGLQRAMLALIDNGHDPRLAHPAYWAPFVYVGGR